MISFANGKIKFVKGGKYPFCHSVLIDDRDRAVIDASSDRDELQQFKDSGPIDYLIASHAHEDHLIYNYLFSDSKFCVHPLDAPQFENIDSLIDSYGEIFAKDRETWRTFLQKDCHYIPRPPDLLLNDGMVMDLGDIQMEVIHTPGHTPGHCSFYFVNQRVIFTTDWDLTKAGPYYGDPGSDIDQTIRSLERLKTFDAETYLTSHGQGIWDGDPTHIDRYMDIIFSREERVVDLLSKGAKTLDEVAREGIVYGKRSISVGPWDLAISERMMILKHLSRLISTNRVTQEGDLYMLV